MKNKIFAILFIFLIMTCFSFEVIHADLLNDIFSSGGNFINQGKVSGSAANSFGHKIQSQIFGPSGLGLQGIFQLVGNAIFLIVTVILGIKYIFSGVEGKSIVKETLPTFIVILEMKYKIQQMLIL